MDPFTGLVAELTSLGFYEFLLPWLLTFAIVYGLLVKADLFDKVNKKVSGVIAIVIAFFITAYSGPTMAAYFTTLFAGFSTIAAAIIVIVLFAALVGFEINWKGSKKNVKYGTLAVLVAIGVVLFLIAAGASWLRWTLWQNSYLTAVFMILLVLVAVAFVMTDEETDQQQTHPPRPAGG